MFFKNLDFYFKNLYCFVSAYQKKPIMDEKLCDKTKIDLFRSIIFLIIFLLFT